MPHTAFDLLTIEEITARLARYSEPDCVAMVMKAYSFAENAHKGQTRRSGEEYIVHPLNVASILSELQLDCPTVVAALLHDTVEDVEGVTLDLIEKEFTPEVRGLVDGVTKLGRLDFADREEQQAENWRKMILAMGKDIRVIMIKLADRMHNMRTLSFQPQDRQLPTARETLDIYAPIAHRLGVYTIKAELEDLSLRFIDPQGYKDVATKVGQKRIEREAQIRTIIQTLTDKLKEMEVENFEIEGRPKHLYSIYRKMVIQNRTFDQIYDLIAIRVLVDTIPECYTVLGAAHTLWTQMPGRFKDYISTPKPNMYQSLHTTLIGGRMIPTPFEVQIRTREMHRIAEEGIAAHWKYKEGRVGAGRDEQHFQWLRQLLEWQQEVRDPQEFLRNLKIELYPEEVYIFTPKGEVKALPRGATPVDFAYSVHTDVGHQCVGARVNGKMVPLRTRLRNGDIVEIVRQPGHKPSRDWLNFVATSRARNKIRHFIHGEEKARSLELGRKLFDKEARRFGLNVKSLTEGEKFAALLAEHGFQKGDELFTAIGYGKLAAKTVLARLVPQEELKEPQRGPIASVVRRVLGPGEDKIKVRGVDDLMVFRARCCNPIRGEQIIGYITRGKGVSVHS
ncbi:MAG TPA: bifunctional (p)ppGpp synthetase/guanosine-3',5'-bis(diphosphate) 3'-pyrophosphohydrolase, partial [Candidatus Limnocylindria bacterium]|nr:bifunctional (p)ppGpp synthetase/guanosine-3',5'-bis(diphosphate) 3'-pyrophosphohydrolase [Candidatus Limnocylindria bacterium]